MNALSATRWFPPAARAVIVALSLLALAAPTYSSTAAVDATTQSRNEAVVRAAFDSWAAGANVFGDLLAPDVVWTIHGSGPVAGTYRGRADFVERASLPLVSRLATPIVPQVHDIWAVGDTVIIRFDGQATTTSGAPYRNQFVWIFRMRDETVIKAEAFLDLAAYQQVVDNNQPRTP